MNYLITGDDEYIKSSEIKKIKNNFLTPQEIDLNYSVYNFDEIKEVMDSLGTMPFLASKRVVLLNNAQRLLKDDMETVFLYLKRNSDTNVLILSAEASFGKTKYSRELASLVKVIKADRPRPLELKRWIQTFLKKEGIQISAEAIDLLVELRGTDTVGVKTEIDKLICFSDSRKIGLKDVEDLVGRSVMESIFKLVDAINSNNGKWTFKVINDLYGQKKQPHEIIGYLGWYLRTIRKIKFLAMRGTNISGISVKLGYSPNYTARLFDQAKQYSLDKIKSWMDLIFEADYQMKTGQRQARVALEMVLVSFLKVV
ncbi:MAG: DNA polymerase III subunit delta [Candidatus Omnitrophota bacterium]